MKTIKLILLITLTIFVSCSADNDELDCALNFEKRLDELYDTYTKALLLPDENGNMSSTEKCLQDRVYTIQFLERLRDFEIELNSIVDCSEADIARFRERITTSIADKEEALETVYNDC